MLTVMLANCFQTNNEKTGAGRSGLYAP